MFALELSTLLLTCVQNKLKLNFESLRGDKDKERAWKKPGSWQGSAASCCESWVLPTFPP